MNEQTRTARRWFLQQNALGMGALALAELFGARPASADATQPLAAKAPHFKPQAKRVVHLFMGGAPSHLELFDCKPQLAKFDGTLPPPELLKDYRAAFINPNSKLLGPKFKFAKHGKSGTELSELLPHLSKVVDDIALVKGLHTEQFNHAPAQVFMSAGSAQPGRPSFGAWSLYGLGSETANLPGYVVLQTGEKGPSGGDANWGSGFLPSSLAGVPFRSGGDPVLYLSNPPGIDRAAQRASVDAVGALNRLRLEETGDPEIATRLAQFETAFQMQAHAPEAMDLSKEPKHILDLYGAVPGKASFANNCLLARRLLERGVRFVELFHESWDQHGNLKKDLAKNCRDTDQASAALVADLKQRGMLDDTLVVWGGEFGRTPMVQGGGNDGRDHHPNCFSMWLAGGGIKPGAVVGKSDDLGFNAAEDRMSVHDLHATLLHLLGFDHAKLTFKFQGRPFRLTDVFGEVQPKLLARPPARGIA